MEEKLDQIKNSNLYRHADVWTGGSIGGNFQAMERYPESFEKATDYAIEIPEQFFSEEFNSWNGDKLIHATASYSLSRGVIKATDQILNDPSIYTKASFSFAAITALGGWKELEYDNYPDPLDMAANYAGWMMAVGHEYKIQEDDSLAQNDDKGLEELNETLESDD